jgi:hypothetical protein
MILGVQVKPNAHATKVVAWVDERTVLLAVAAPPTEGRANEAVLRFLADTLGLARSAVVLKRGAAARVKHVELPDGTSLEPLR